MYKSRADKWLLSVDCSPLHLRATGGGYDNDKVQNSGKVLSQERERNAEVT